MKQLKGQAQSYAALDDLVVGDGQRVPLWMFGMLY